ncbi:MAG: SpoVR family protein [Chloroflexi bacterium]|nr:SpoVR family protein [Chloroflexota bacterium]
MDSELVATQKAIEDIWQVAERLGLDPFPIEFEIVPAAMIYEFGAYGLPGRFSHWTHGKAYHQMKTMYDYGLSKIYELVINTNPCYAFLLEGNSLLQNKLVIAHVIAHCDFFKNNVYFQRTNRRMVESASASAERIRRYEFLHGTVEVEKFLDAVLSIQEHIDPDPFPRKAGKVEAHAARTTPYDDLFYIGDEKRGMEQPARVRRTPEEPRRDLLLFITENAVELEDWQRDIIDIVRAEMLYFLPQAQTKIMNEGWASYWHSRILRELDLSDDESIEFARMHAGVLAPSRQHINPYHLGLKILENIQKRWDAPTDEERRSLGRRGGEGHQKIFDVRGTENDISFLRNYLTRRLVEDLDLYIYRQDGDEWRIVEKSWERVREMLVNAAVTMGQPCIVVEDGDYHGNRELYLKHMYEGQALDLAYAEKTLRQVHVLWRRTVHLETVIDGKRVLLSYDGAKNDRAVA